MNIESLLHPILGAWLSLVSAQPFIGWLVAVLVSFRLLVALVQATTMRRLKIPGVQRWPAMYVARSIYLIRCTRVLTPWRYYFVSGLSRLAANVSKYVFLLLIVSFIPHPVIRHYLPLPWQWGMAAYIVSTVVLDRTRLHRILGSWILGATTDVLITRRNVFVLRFVGAILPVLRCYRRSQELSLAAHLEPHEQAPEERNSNGRPVFSDSWIVCLVIGNEPVRVATVFGQTTAERIVNAFAALREELEKRRGVFKRKMTDGAWSFGQIEPRAE